jgi:hypothetical protein
MRLHNLFAATALALMAAPASADTICEWAEFTQKIVPPGPGIVNGLTPVYTGEHAVAQTQVVLAMFEAVNAIDRRYRSYVGMPLADAGANQEVAAMTAAARVLLAHFPGKKADVEESYLLALSGVPEGAAKAAGIAAGEAAAKAALARGDIDKAIVQQPYRPQTQPGVWVATALPATRPHQLAFKPWVLKRPDEVRPPAPPALTSARYARDLEEVKRLGGRDSKERTSVQTLMARYRITSTEMPALRTVADQQGRRLVDNARLFALYGMLADDLGLASAEAKLHYNYWRPITAIRNADRDGNPATTIDPSWEPLMSTPNHGEYPCGHCIFAGGIAEMMTAVGGKAPAWGVRVGSMSLPNSAIQVLPDWNTWAEQVSFSRTLGGVHYRFSNEAGEEMGRKLARLALERVLQPLPEGERRPAS